MPPSRRNAAKIQTLRQQGVLNPHPEAVTDPLFQTADFFDPQDLLQVKYEMLRRVEVDKRPITQAAAAFGLSRPAFYQAQHAVVQQGVAGLIPRKRGPHGAHKLTPAVLDFVLEQRAASPSITIAELITRIQRQFGVAVHRRTLERHLARQEKKLRPQS
jgi:transposase